jgi:LacI family transcriptional regulator
MSSAVTIADVAKLAGVHAATVSRALNPSAQAQVSPETVRRVQKAAKALGYVPNAMARSLRTSLSMTVGVTIPDLTNPIFPPLIRGIENFLAPRGYTVLLANTDGRPALEKAAITSLLERRVDGLIIATGLDDHALLPKLFDQGVRAVLANRGAGTVPYPLVTGDDSSGITLAVDLLKKLGHRQIVHIAGPDNFSTSRTRREAMVRVCEDAGLKCEVVVAAALSADDGEKAMDDLLSQRQTFTAVQAGNDLLALGVLRSMRRHRLRCPEDISVIGFNDMPFAEEFSPGLTTIRVPLEDIGTESARLLFERIQSGKSDSLLVRLPVSLVVRGSTGPAPKTRGSKS